MREFNEGKKKHTHTHRAITLSGNMESINHQLYTSFSSSFFYDIKKKDRRNAHHNHFIFHSLTSFCEIIHFDCALTEYLQSGFLCLKSTSLIEGERWEKITDAGKCMCAQTKRNTSLWLYLRLQNKELKRKEIESRENRTNERIDLNAKTRFA